jgi:hypothetical protein
VYVYMFMSCNVYIIFIIINIETLFEKNCEYCKKCKKILFIKFKFLIFRDKQ